MSDDSPTNTQPVPAGELSVQQRIAPHRPNSQAATRHKAQGGQNSSPCGARDTAGAYAPNVSPARRDEGLERMNTGSARAPVLSKRSTRTPVLSTFLRMKVSFDHISPHGLQFCPPTAAPALHGVQFCPPDNSQARNIAAFQPDSRSTTQKQSNGLASRSRAVARSIRMQTVQARMRLRYDSPPPLQPKPKQK